MYRKIEDFISDWKTEQEFTLKIFSKIPDESITVKSVENIRSLGRLAWHITQTLTEMPHKAGIISEDFLENKPIPNNFSKIISEYKFHSEQLIVLLKEKWVDSNLFEIIDVYGQQWEKQKILSALINHQIHHRAQMTILMRLQNLDVPGIYGPSKEEWLKFGMTPHE